MREEQRKAGRGEGIGLEERRNAADELEEREAETTTTIAVPPGTTAPTLDRSLIRRGNRIKKEHPVRDMHLRVFT